HPACPVVPSSWGGRTWGTSWSLRRFEQLPDVVHGFADVELFACSLCGEHDGCLSANAIDAHDVLDIDEHLWPIGPVDLDEDTHLRTAPDPRRSLLSRSRLMMASGSHWYASQPRHTPSASSS